MSEVIATPKTLFIAGQLGKGGAEKELYLLLKHLRHTAVVVSLSSGGYWADPIRALGYEVVELERSSHADSRRLWKLTQLIHTYRPEIVQIMGDSVSGLYGRIAALLNHHSHTIVNVRHHPSRDPAWYRLLKRYCLDRSVQMFLTNSSATREYLITNLKVRPAKVTLIPNGIELDLFASKDRAPSNGVFPAAYRGKVTVGTVGKLTPVKAPEVFVRAAERVVKQTPETAFVYIGDGPLRPEIEQLRHELELENSLCLLGQRDDIPDLLRSLDIFVLSSRSEGMPNAVMEAMAAGLPCVVTDAGDCRRLIREGENGFVVPVGSDDLMAARILQLVHDEPLRRRMGEKSREYIQAYDVSAMVEKYSALYNVVLNKNREGSA